MENQSSDAPFSPLRVAVVGVGNFGRLHAKHYAQNKNAELVAVVDTVAEAADAIGREFGGVDLDIERDKTPARTVNFG